MSAEDKKIVDINGYWEIKKNPISKVGVFQYLGRQISPQLEPNKIYNVYRPAEELFNEKTKESFKLVPFTDEHTMLGKGDGLIPAEKKGVQGVTGEEIENDDNTLYVNLKIYSEELKDKIEQGKKELSLGYHCDYELTSGDFQGEHYDAIQRNIIGNHIALVHNGRMGADVRVMDNMFTTSQGEEKLLTKKGDIVENNNIDKRKNISEIEAMLFEVKKDPTLLTDEMIKTILQKVENNSYTQEENKDEETTELKTEENKDEEEKTTDEEDLNAKIDKILELLTKDKVADNDDCKDEQEKTTDEQEKKDNEKIATDSMLSIIAEQERIYNQARKLVGDFDYKSMTASKIAKYTCDKLDIDCTEKDAPLVLKGYIKANNKNNQLYSMDAKIHNDNIVDAEIEKYKQTK